METDNNEAKVLLQRIKGKRRELARYIEKNEPRHSRLVNASIICGALTAALTAGPGVGGNGFIESIANIVSFGIPLWQVLCLAAALLSVTAVITNGMLKSQDLTTKVTQARSCASKLEGLEALLELAQVDVRQATPLYAQYIAEASHV